MEAQFTPLANSRGIEDVLRCKRRTQKHYLDSLRKSGFILEDEFVKASNWNVEWITSRQVVSTIMYFSLHKPLTHSRIRHDFSIDLDRELQLWMLEGLILKALVHGLRILADEPYSNIIPMFGGMVEVCCFSERTPFGLTGCISYSPWDDRKITPRSRFFVPQT
jgi:hypothetical protein